MLQTGRKKNIFSDFQSKLAAASRFIIKPTMPSTIILAVITACFPISALAQTAYDVQVQQAQAQEQQYENEVARERSAVEPYKEMYERKLQELNGICKPGSIVHKARNPVNKDKEVALINRWLAQEEETEARENSEINNLHGWTEYWISRQRGVYQDMSWNNSQAQIDAQVAQKQAAEKARWTAMEAQTAAGEKYYAQLNAPVVYGGRGGWGGGHGWGGSHGWGSGHAWGRSGGWGRH